MRLNPTEMLESEHRIIQKVVTAAAILADRLAAGADPDIHVLVPGELILNSIGMNGDVSKANAFVFDILVMVVGLFIWVRLF